MARTGAEALGADSFRRVLWSLRIVGLEVDDMVWMSAQGRAKPRPTRVAGLALDGHGLHTMVAVARPAVDLVAKLAGVRQPTITLGCPAVQHSATSFGNRRPVIATIAQQAPVRSQDVICEA